MKLASRCNIQHFGGYTLDLLKKLYVSGWLYLVEIHVMARNYMKLISFREWVRNNKNFKVTDFK